MKCPCMKMSIDQFEKKYNIKIFSIKYSCPCGTNVESKKIVDKGVGFYKWARGLTKKDFRTIK